MIWAVVCFLVAIAITVFEPLPFPFSLIGAVALLLLAYVFFVGAMFPR